MAPQSVPVVTEADALLAQLLGGGGASASTLLDPPGLQHCPACEMPFVVPQGPRVSLGAGEVRAELACRNCETRSTEVRSDAELAALDAFVDRSFADLLWTLEMVWVANEESAIERFAGALDAGAILPEDFAA